MEPETSKGRARNRRFFNPLCSICSRLSHWTRIRVLKVSETIFNKPYEAELLVTSLQDQGIPAIRDHVDDDEYLVTRYMQVDEDRGCPEGFTEACILDDGKRCEFYLDGACLKPEEAGN